MGRSQKNSDRKKIGVGSIALSCTALRFVTEKSGKQGEWHSIHRSRFISATVPQHHGHRSNQRGKPGDEEERRSYDALTHSLTWWAMKALSSNADKKASINEKTSDVTDEYRQS